VITKVAPFMQEYERLAASHMAKASEQGQQAALITCERNQACFAAWGRPFAFHALRLLDLEREEEARDLARQALSMPLWTLSADLEEVLSIAQMSREELTAKLRLKESGQQTAEELRASNGMEKRTPQQIAKDRASYLLDLVVAAPDEFSWLSCRAQLAKYYLEAGMSQLAQFVDPEVPKAYLAE